MRACRIWFKYENQLAIFVYLDPPNVEKTGTNVPYNFLINIFYSKFIYNEFHCNNGVENSKNLYAKPTRV